MAQQLKNKEHPQVNLPNITPIHLIRYIGMLKQDIRYITVQ